MCRGTGTFECRADETGTQCNITSPGASPSPEVCNGLDDNCNGSIDEGLSCGGCGDVETCNNVDDDCDGSIDEGLSRACGTDVGECTAGTEVCVPGVWQGCTATGPFLEVCDGLDNDCNGVCDGLVRPCSAMPPNPNIGPCHDGTQVCPVSCTPPNGWLGCTGEVTPQPEVCNCIDDDCDSIADDGTGGLACDTTCGLGTTSCNPATCALECNAMMQPDDDTCNNIDDDCDGTVDEGAPDAMAEVRDASNVLLFRIYANEASRPDATSTTGGVMSHRACAMPLVVPWASVTYDEAAAACTAAGKRLCTAAEWQRACAGNAGLVYPYGDAYEPTTCNGNDYDPDCGSPDADVVLPTGTPHGCPTKPAQSACESPFGAFDLSGNLKEWTSTATSADAFNVRGGAVDSAAGGLACDFAFVSMDRAYAFYNVGFRCCEDP